MRTSRTLVESDNPDDPNRRYERLPISHNPATVQPPPSASLQVKMGRFFYLIHDSIPRPSWAIEWHDDVNIDMDATLHLMTDIGEIRIHAIYNPNQPGQTLDAPAMLAKTMASGFDIVMGDFNLHHPSWSGPLYRGDPNKV
jgi:hypothetical protein